MIRTIAIELPDWIDDCLEVGRSASSDADRMAFAIALSRANVEHGTGGPFGAAVYEEDSGALVAVGVNRVVPLMNSALHAEVVALMFAQSVVRSYSLDEPHLPRHDLFTSCEPCAMCVGAIWWSGVRRVVCGASRADATDLGFDEGPVFAETYSYLKARGIQIVHGVMREDARAVLRLYADGHGIVYNA